MFELKSMTYEESRKEYFEELKVDAIRKMEYWSKRVDKDGPWNPRVRANIYASEWGAVVSYLNDALEALDCICQPEAQIPKWISVEERLPKDYVDVLVYDKLDGIGVCQYSSVLRKFFGDEEGMYLEITHWMPLPEPPKEG